MEMRSRTAAPGEAGMVTAEIAVALPAVVLVLLLVLSAVCAGVTQLRVTDAARVAARQAAIGSDDVEGAAVHAGGAVRVDVERGELTCVHVSRPVPGPGTSPERFWRSSSPYGSSSRPASSTA